MTGGNPARFVPLLPAAVCVVLIGPAGSGKSTFARAHWGAGQILSLDAHRALVGLDENDQDPAVTAAAVALLHRRLNARLARRHPVVVDATNVEARARAPLLAAARHHHVPAVAVVFAGVPVEVCLARNAARPGPGPGRRWGRRVPEEVVRVQHQLMLDSPPHLSTEGFAAVHVHP